MRKLNVFIHSLLLMTTPPLLVYPQNHLHQLHSKKHPSEKLKKNFRKKERYSLITYDEILELLTEIETGEAEKKYRPKDQKRIDRFLVHLAEQGILPHDEHTHILKKDIKHLLSDHDFFTFDKEDTTLYQNQIDQILCKNKFKKNWGKTKYFVKKHKREIIIGAVIVVAVAAVAVAVVVVSSASAASAAAGAAGAAGAAAAGSSSGPNSSRSSQSESSGSSSPSGSQPSPNEATIFKTAMDEQISSFKGNLSQENFFGPSSTNGQGLSLEETGRVVGPLFAHDSFNHFNDQLSSYPQFSEEVQNIASQHNFSLPPGANNNPVDFGHNEIDRRFASNCGPLFSDLAKEVNFNALSYQMRGEAARSYGYYGQAVNDFSKAIDMNPTNPMPYLQRSASYFDMGQYDRSFEDFHNFEAQIEQAPQKIPFSTPEFTLGFAKGLPKGVYESGKGIFLFLGDLVTHPIHTATQMYDALSTLARLARDDEWGMIGEVLSPEIHQLVTQWDTLPSDKRGELAGYAFGKHGADIAAPGAVAKIASKSAKSARELAAVLKNLQRAEGTLVLETAAGVGNTARVGEIINTGKTSAFLGEEFGFTAKEMGQLQKAGKLEGAINDALENFATKSPSEAYIIAKSGGKHADLIPQYSGRSIKEIQKGIKSYEKQVAIHKDKIANPSKYCPDWDKMDPRHKKSLVEVKWPSEIKLYTEQGNVLQSILDLKQ